MATPSQNFTFTNRCRVYQHTHRYLAVRTPPLPHHRSLSRHVRYICPTATRRDGGSHPRRGSARTPAVRRGPSSAERVRAACHTRARTWTPACAHCRLVTAPCLGLLEPPPPPGTRRLSIHPRHTRARVYIYAGVRMRGQSISGNVVCMQGPRDSWTCV